MIIKITKFIVKLIIGIALGIGLGIYLVCGSVNAIKTANEDPNKKASFVIESFEICGSYPPGTWHSCPMCQKNFLKEDINFCSKKCEQEFRKMKENYEEMQTAEKNLKKLGKRYK